MKSLPASFVIDINLLGSYSHSSCRFFYFIRCHLIVIPTKKIEKTCLKWKASFAISIIIKLNYICVFKRGSLCRILPLGRGMIPARYPLCPCVLLVKAATGPRVKGKEHGPCLLVRDISKNVWLTYFPLYMFSSKTQMVVPASPAQSHNQYITTKSSTLKATEVLQASSVPHPALSLELSPDR